MIQSELWFAKWKEAIDFLETNHRKPSKFIPEEHNIRSCWKHNKKLMKAGDLKLEWIEMFKQLLEVREKHRRELTYMTNPVLFLYSTPKVIITWLFKIDDNSSRNSSTIE